MNIFLDTSVIYKDPFWKGNFYRELLNLILENEVNLYASTVVMKEMELNYERKIEDENIRLEKLNNDLLHYGFKSSPIQLIDTDTCKKRLLDFYKDLIEKNVLSILDFDPGILTETFDRALKKSKPFFDSKGEIKDAVIWLTYARYAEKKRFKNCIFLTANPRDFAEKDPNGNFIINSLLASDSSRFKVYLSPKELLQGEKDLLMHVQTKKFAKWIKGREINEEVVMDIMLQNYEDLICQKITTEVSVKHPELEINEIEFGPIHNISIDKFKNECLISGEFFADVFTSRSYDTWDSNGDTCIETEYRNCEAILYFSFYYNQDETPKFLEIEKVRLIY